MNKSKKYYGVLVGVGAPAVFETWEECAKSVVGFTGAKYKSFYSRAEAEAYAFPVPQAKAPVDVVAFTDGSYTSFTDETNYAGYAFILLENGEPVAAEYGPTTEDAAYRNISGEVQAAQRAIEDAIRLGYKHVEVHHDYQGISEWGVGAWKCNNDLTRRYRNFCEEAGKRIDISFVKVAGHTGVEMNELADHYAGIGAKLQYAVQMESKEEILAPFAPKAEAKPQVFICPVCHKRVARLAQSCRHCNALFTGEIKPELK